MQKPAFTSIREFSELLAKANGPDADALGVTQIGWFDDDDALRSGWAWGQDHLFGGTAVATAKVGAGQLHLFTPEILFRGQPHGTFQLLFNGIYLATATPTSIGGDL